MAKSRLVPELVPLDELETQPTSGLGIPGWVRYGSVIAAVALTAARVAGVAYADDGGHSGGGHSGGGDHGGHGGDHAGHGADHAATVQAPVSASATHSDRGGTPKAVQAVNATQVRGEDHGHDGAADAATANNAQTVAAGQVAQTANTVAGDSAQTVAAAGAPAPSANSAAEAQNVAAGMAETTAAAAETAQSVQVAGVNMPVPSAASAASPASVSAS